MPGMVVRASHAATTITTARVGGASGTVMVSTPQHYAVLCSTMQYYAALCSTMQYYAVLCSTMQYYGVIGALINHISAGYIW